LQSISALSTAQVSDRFAESIAMKFGGDRLQAAAKLSIKTHVAIRRNLQTRVPLPFAAADFQVERNATKKAAPVTGVRCRSRSRESLRRIFGDSPCVRVDPKRGKTEVAHLRGQALMSQNDPFRTWAINSGHGLEKPSRVAISPNLIYVNLGTR